MRQRTKLESLPPPGEVLQRVLLYDSERLPNGKLRATNGRWITLVSPWKQDSRRSELLPHERIPDVLILLPPDETCSAIYEDGLPRENVERRGPYGAQTGTLTAMAGCGFDPQLAYGKVELKFYLQRECEEFETEVRHASKRRHVPEWIRPVDPRDFPQLKHNQRKARQKASYLKARKRTWRLCRTNVAQGIPRIPVFGEGRTNP